MLDFLKKFETWVVCALAILMAVTVLSSTLELAMIIGTDLLTPPYFLLDGAELLEIFGFFLMVMLGLELLETIKAYLKDDVVHVEVVLLVAVIAIARKAVILDFKEASGMTLTGLAVLLAALVGGYVYIKRAGSSPRTEAAETPVKKP